jgi:hypothetical protein
MTYYSFLIKRPADSKPWPVIFESREAAEKYPARVSEIYVIEMTEKTDG